MTLRRFFLTFNKKNDKQKYLVPLFCPLGYLIFYFYFFNKKFVFRFSVSLERNAASAGNFLLTTGGILVASISFFLLKLSKISLVAAVIIPPPPAGEASCCSKLNRCTRLLLTTVKKNALFFRNVIKKLTTLYRVAGNLGTLFFVLWIAHIFFTETQNGWRRNGAALLACSSSCYY